MTWILKTLIDKKNWSWGAKFSTYDYDMGDVESPIKIGDLRPPENTLSLSTDAMHDDRFNLEEMSGVTLISGN